MCSCDSSLFYFLIDKKNMTSIMTNFDLNHHITWINSNGQSIHMIGWSTWRLTIDPIDSKLISIHINSYYIDWWISNWVYIYFFLFKMKETYWESHEKKISEFLNYLKFNIDKCSCYMIKTKIKSFIWYIMINSLIVGNLEFWKIWSLEIIFFIKYNRWSQQKAKLTKNMN